MAATPTYIADASGTGATLSLTGAASGDLLVIFTKDGVGSTQVATGITDDSGSGSWTLLSAAPTSGAVGRRIELWLKLDSAAVTTVAVAQTGSNTGHAVLIRLDGISDTSPTGAYASTFQASTATPTELTIALSEANMLVISACQANANTQAQHVAESGWTKGTTGSTGPAWAWRNDLGAVTDGCVWTLTSAQGNGTAIVSFKKKATTSGPTMTLWNGTAEVAVTVTLWNGTSEVALSLDSVA